MQNVKKTERIYTEITSMRSFISNLEAYGDKILYRYFTDSKTLSEMSYRQFTTLVKNIAGGLTSLGLAGKKIAIVGETSPFWVGSYLGILTSGGIAVPLDKELALSEMEGLLAQAEVDGIIYSASFNGKLDGAMENHVSLKTFIPMNPDGAELQKKVLSLKQVEEEGQKNEGYTFPETDIMRTAEMLFTSGTTGSSKCVLLSEQNIFTTINSACATVNFGKEDVLVSVLPIHHTYELCCMQAAMNYGTTIGINDSLKHVLRNFKTFEPTALVLVPLIVNVMYKKINDEVRKKGKEKTVKFASGLSRTLRHLGIDVRRKLFHEILDSFGGKLNKIIVGGAALNPALCDIFFEYGIQICEGYGITECSPLIAVNPYFKGKDKSVGPAVPCCKTQIMLDNKPVPVGETGEICVKGTNVMQGYLNNDEANAEAFTTDGWFRTGDMGHMDEEGYIYITGRYKSVIVLENGKNVFPEEIEEYLENIKGLREAVVVGRKAEGQEEVVLTAIIVPDFDQFEAGVEDSTIQKHFEDAINLMNKNLPTFKHVKTVEIRHEEFEKTTTKKIRRHLIH